MPAPAKPELVVLEPQHIAVIRRSVPIGQLREVFDHGFGAVMEVLGKQGVQPAGPPIGLYHSMPGDTVDVSVGFPTAEAITPEGEVEASVLPSGEVVKLQHVGAYERLNESYERMMDWMADRMLLADGPMWEQYMTEPDEANPSATLTELYCPVTERHSGGVEG